MTEVIGAVLGPAAGVALSPFPIIAVILMLFTGRPRLNGTLFTLGFAVGLAALGAVIIALTDASGADEPGEASDLAYWLRIVAGLALLVLGARKLHGTVHRTGDEPAMPRWMASIDRVGPARALVTGLLLGGVNPKNIVFTLAAGMTIAQGGLQPGQEWVALGVYVLAASSTCILTVAYRVLAGDRAAARLEVWRTWLAAHSSVVMAGLFLVFGVVLVGQGLDGL